MAIDYRSVCFEAHGRECVNCGAENNLIAHHVNGDRADNDPSNLLPMCPDCHRRVHRGEPGFEEWSDQLPSGSMLYVNESDIIGKDILLKFPDDRLVETDFEILKLLEDGRETTGSLAEALDKHPQTIRDRLRWLREWDYVQYHHEDTGLHDINGDDDG